MMGMFDYVQVGCPKCSNILEYQTKNLDCCLMTINLDEDLPISMARHFMGDKWKCDKCGTEFVMGEVPREEKIKLGKTIL